MQKVAIDDVEPGTADSDRTHDRRSLTDRLDAAHVAINHYVLDPGERFSGSLHAHADQEEVFVVLDGEATFETRGPVENAGRGSDDSMNAEERDEIREVTVAAGEAVRFAPGEFQTGRNDSNEQVVALALGAPCDSEDVRIARIPGFGDVSCPDCEHDHMRIPEEAGSGLVCPNCGGELEVA